MRWAVGLIGIAVVAPTFFIGLWWAIGVSLWAAVYGDSLGGRWGAFGIPPAGTFAFMASAAIARWIATGWRPTWRTVLFVTVLLMLVSFAWLTFAVLVLLPPI